MSTLSQKANLPFNKFLSVDAAQLCIEFQTHHTSYNQGDDTWGMDGTYTAKELEAMLYIHRFQRLEKEVTQLKSGETFPPMSAAITHVACGEPRVDVPAPWVNWFSETFGLTQDEAIRVGKDWIAEVKDNDKKCARKAELTKQGFSCEQEWLRAPHMDAYIRDLPTLTQEEEDALSKEMERRIIDMLQRVPVANAVPKTRTQEDKESILKKLESSIENLLTKGLYKANPNTPRNTFIDVEQAEAAIANHGIFARDFDEAEETFQLDGNFTITDLEALLFIQRQMALESTEVVSVNVKEADLVLLEKSPPVAEAKPFKVTDVDKDLVKAEPGDVVSNRSMGTPDPFETAVGFFGNPKAFMAPRKKGAPISELLSSTLSELGLIEGGQSRGRIGVRVTDQKGGNGVVVPVSPKDKDVGLEGYEDRTVGINEERMHRALVRGVELKGSSSKLRPSILEFIDGHKGDILAEVIFYGYDPENVWNPDRYVTRNLSAKACGLEASLKLAYVRGSSFVHGYVGEYSFRIYYSTLQGFQIWHAPLGTPAEQEGDIPMTFSPDNIVEAYDYIASIVTKA